MHVLVLSVSREMEFWQTKCFDFLDKENKKRLHALSIYVLRIYLRM